ncbi:MAG: type III pantothenate kinase [Candidatus Saganbacteria bacterium]|nr:type III pantothenate kinase [Candidatus Saganbacteria bacterium]
MLLTVDIGNTNIVAGLFENDRLIKKFRFSTYLNDYKKQFFSFKGAFIEGVIISSVVPAVEKNIGRILNRLFGIEPFFLNAATFNGLMKILLKNKNEIGVDRLADSYAAMILYGKPLIVIDFGTATTFCAVDKKGSYLGGAISPGVAISRDALHEKTAKLPLVALKVPVKAIGGSTVSAMQSGIIYGYAGIVESLVKRFREKLGKKTRVVATGGLAGIISSQTDIIDVVDPDLTLKGLNLIWKAIWKS